MTTNDPKFRFHTLFSSDAQKPSKKHGNTTRIWTRCQNCGLGAKPFLSPPAKADIATAILTNVIEHVVLLFPPNEHAFTAKAVWADLTFWQFIYLASKFIYIF